MIINIIGMGKGKHLAPEGIRWGITGVVYTMRCDAIFDIHDPVFMTPEGNNMFRARVAICESQGIPHYSCRKLESPASRAYPLKEIVEHFDCDLFTSTVDYTLAMAIYQNPKQINLYGINCVKPLTIEYQHQKPSIQYWIGIAQGRGIKVTVNGDHTEVMKTHNGTIYGYNLPQKEVKNYVRSL